MLFYDTISLAKARISTILNVGDSMIKKSFGSNWWIVLMLGWMWMNVSWSSETTDESFTEMKGHIDAINETLTEVKNTVDKLNKIKVSGYVQAQWQVADGDGIASFAGGNFPMGVHQRFAIRRGRVKFAYEEKFSTYVVQLDVTQGGVRIKDAYLRVNDPWRLGLALTAGGFDRPFGFEISHSSGLRESPERSRIFQTLFPGERDIGFQFSYANEMGPLHFLNAKFGAFNGTGIEANENDNHKDIIGRIGVALPMYELNMALDGGVSLYRGKVRNNSKYYYEMENKTFKLDSSASNQWKYHDRTVYGVDVQYYADLPYIGGFQVRAEYLIGKQPSTEKSNAIYLGTDANTPLYQREIQGYYFKLIQNVGTKNQLVVKYDTFDPNTKVSGADVGASGSNLTAADLSYTTLGFGIIHHWDANLKVTLYYDKVTNEKANQAATGSLAPYREDLMDNVFTVRLQYRF
ncbi:MAG: OprO/OprP family phosphate-selective porin [bacterium]|nr:OprO/OprP family phosphate-selective porin [bacterium]